MRVVLSEKESCEKSRREEREGKEEQGRELEGGARGIPGGAVALPKVAEENRGKKEMNKGGGVALREIAE